MPVDQASYNRHHQPPSAVPSVNLITSHIIFSQRYHLLHHPALPLCPPTCFFTARGISLWNARGQKPAMDFRHLWSSSSRVIGHGIWGIVGNVGELASLTASDARLRDFCRFLWPQTTWKNPRRFSAKPHAAESLEPSSITRYVGFSPHLFPGGNIVAFHHLCACSSSVRPFFFRLFSHLAFLLSAPLPIFCFLSTPNPS
jgi:hypothetical protein